MVYSCSIPGNVEKKFLGPSDALMVVWELSYIVRIADIVFWVIPYIDSLRKPLIFFCHCQMFWRSWWKILNYSYQTYGLFLLYELANDKNLRWCISTLSETISVLSWYRLKVFKNFVEKKRVVNFGKDSRPVVIPLWWDSILSSPLFKR